MNVKWLHQQLAFVLLLIRDLVFFVLHFVCFFSIPHDLARSCFQLWHIIGDKSVNILKKITGKALAKTAIL